MPLNGHGCAGDHGGIGNRRCRHGQCPNTPTGSFPVKLIYLLKRSAG